MKKFFKKETLIIVACISFIIASIEGYQYYEKYEMHAIFRIIMTVNNSLQAFFLKPTIKIEDMVDRLGDAPGIIQVLSAYAYAAVVVIAPLCTGYTVILGFRLLLRKRVHLDIGKKADRVLILAYM
jgi:hypothetical protein